MKRNPICWLCLTLAALWLAGCGGSSSTASAPSTPIDPNTPSNPNTPTSPSFPSTNRLRLYQHGDEFIYDVRGVARYLERRYEVSGTLTERISSVGAGMLRVSQERRLTLRRGTETLQHNRLLVFYITQDRQSREVTLVGYALNEGDPLINSNLPYRTCAPGILNENSNFSFSVAFEDGVATTETWQIGAIEPVPTYAGEYYCYRMRVESLWDNPAPFRDSTSAATCWFSPQLGRPTRSETLESTWLNSEPIEYRLTILLQRTNVSLRPASL
ncbi:MAG: hypothetical protein NZ874_10205 [Fimbriimonadales bacterium]|nr:hypothetical protein [Fimbriimonadales bacterium]